MRNFIKAAAALGAFTIAVIVPAVPTISAVGAAETPKGYVVTEAETGCDLQQVDLTTGVLTDLPAASDSAACAVDLAVSPTGVVHGITQNEGGPFLVTYAADGSATQTPITVAGDDGTGLAQGGIAISASGTIYVHLVASIEGCDTGTPGTVVGTPGAGPLYQGDSVCLFTLDAGSGAATLIGTTGLFETYFFDLTSCTSGLRTLFADNELQAITWATESSATGAVTPGPDADAPLGGYDCASTGDTLYAVTNPAAGLGSPNATPAAASMTPGVGTIDTATGAYTETAPLSDPTALVMALGVAPTAVTPPTTSGGVADATVVAPTFTG
jgi:hypothetical protein